MKQIVAVRISIGLVSCQEEITGQQVPPGEPFKLKVGQQVEVALQTAFRCNFR